MAYEVIPYAPEFEPQIVRLQTHLWSSDPAHNAAYFRWKYADNPFLEQIVLQLTLFEGRVVAMHGMVGAMWQVGDKATRHLLPHTDDLVVAPEHRHRGVASQIMRANLRGASLRGFPFVVSLSASPATFIIALAAGWRSVGSYESVWRNTRSRTGLNPLRDRVGRTRWYRRLDEILHPLHPGGPFAHLDRKAGRVSERVSLSREPRPEEMAELVAGLPWDGRLRHLRTSDYFAWRFRNPLHEYRFLFWENGGLRGYLVLQRYLSDRLDQGCVNIVDWEASDEEIQTGLLEAALRWGRFPRIQTWTVGTREPVWTLLRHHGFEAPEPSGAQTLGNGLLVHRLDDLLSNERWMLGGRDLLNIADWDLRMLYSMAG